MTKIPHASQRSVGEWVSILNFYMDHVNELSESEVLCLYSEAELCRERFNEDTQPERICKEDDVKGPTGVLYTRAHKIIKDKFNNAVTTAHHIAG